MDNNHWVTSNMLICSNFWMYFPVTSEFWLHFLPDTVSEYTRLDINVHVDCSCFALNQSKIWKPSGRGESFSLSLSGAESSPYLTWTLLIFTGRSTKLDLILTSLNTQREFICSLPLGFCSPSNCHGYTSGYVSHPWEGLNCHVTHVTFPVVHYLFMPVCGGQIDLFSFTCFSPPSCSPSTPPTCSVAPSPSLPL